MPQRDTARQSRNRRQKSGVRSQKEQQILPPVGRQDDIILKGWVSFGESVDVIPSESEESAFSPAMAKSSRAEKILGNSATEAQRKIGKERCHPDPEAREKDLLLLTPDS